MKYVVGMVLLAAFFALGYYLSNVFREPDVEYRERLVYRPRQLEGRDTSDAETPKTTILYQVVRDTVHAECPVPKEFSRVGLIDAHPIRFSGRNVVLTYWAPDSLRYAQDIFVMKRPSFDYGAEIGLTRSIFGPADIGLGLQTWIRYKRFRLEAATSWMASGSAQVRVGLFYRLWQPP